MKFVYVILIFSLVALTSFVVSLVTTQLYLESFLEVSRLLDQAYVEQMVEETLKIIKEQQDRQGG